MTAKDALIQPDRGQPATAIHLVDKPGLEAFLKARSAPQRAALAAQKFEGDGFQHAIVPEGDAWFVAAGVADVAGLSSWCLAKLGEIVDKSVTLGVNQGGGIQFTNDKPEPIITEARKAAVADAIVKAKVLAEAAGVSLGKVVNISEQGYRPEPVPMMRAGMAKEYAADAVPVATGENSYNVMVNVTFEIKQ